MDLLQLFSAKEEIGGLEISRSRLSYLLFSFKNEKISISRQGAAPMEEGVFENGELKNEEKFAAALDGLRAAIKPSLRQNQELSVILCLPSSSAYYTQTLSVPNLPERQIAEAVKLAASTSLPAPVGKIYYDWQDVKAAEQPQKKELLFVLIRKEKLDPVLEILKRKNIAVRAVEFPSLACGRLIANFGEKAGLFVDLAGSEGLNISVVDRGELRFDDFISFSPDIKEVFLKENPREADFKIAKDFLAKKLSEISEYFAVENDVSRIKPVVFSPSDFKSHFEKAAADVGFEVEEIKTRVGASGAFLQKTGCAVLGSALRGLMPREEDTIVSLAPVGTEESYQQKRMTSFLRVIRIIAATVAVFSVVALAGVWLFFRLVLSGVDEQIFQRSGIPVPTDVSAMEEEAKKFNEAVQKMAQIAALTSKQTAAFELIGSLEIPGITLTQISFGKELTQPVNIYGIAKTRETLIEFKKKMESMPEFSDVKMPFSYFQQKTDVAFTMSFIRK